MSRDFQGHEAADTQQVQTPLFFKGRLNVFISSGLFNFAFVVVFCQCCEFMRLDQQESILFSGLVVVVQIGEFVVCFIQPYKVF